MRRIDVKFIDKAADICKTIPAIKNKHRVVAIVTNGKNKVLSVGYNSYTKTHPKQKELALLCNIHHKAYLHAEISALVKLKDSGAKNIYVVRLWKDETFALAKPCRICELAIKEAGLEKIFYTVYNGIKQKMII